jgi:hypothetical protein
MLSIDFDNWNIYQERLTAPPALVEGHEGTGQGGEGKVGVGAALIADGQMAEAGDPRQRALDHPTVAAQALTALDPPARDTRPDSAAPVFPAATVVVVGLVGVHLPGLRRGRPRRPERTCGIASSVATSWVLS